MMSGDFSDETSLCSVLTCAPQRSRCCRACCCASSLAWIATTSAITPRIAASTAATAPKLAQKRARSMRSTRSLSYTTSGRPARAATGAARQGAWGRVRRGVARRRSCRWRSCIGCDPRWLGSDGRRQRARLRALALEALDLVDVLERERDVVEAVQQPLPDLRVDLERLHRGRRRRRPGARGRRRPRPPPSARARPPRAAPPAAAPILVQLA